MTDIWSKPNEIYKQIERIGKTCYKSEAVISNDSSAAFIDRLIEHGHEAMLEHVSMTVKFIVDRGISHELVRHRLASFAQESTRYCNYSKEKFDKEITVIEPVIFKHMPEKEKKLIQDILVHNKAIDETENVDSVADERLYHLYIMWAMQCKDAEHMYMMMLDEGATPEIARSVLPHSLKTEVVMTANMREWRHFLKLRAEGVTGKPHPQMLEVTIPLLEELQDNLPALFGDIGITRENFTYRNPG